VCKYIYHVFLFLWRLLYINVALTFNQNNSHNFYKQTNLIPHLKRYLPSSMHVSLLHNPCSVHIMWMSVGKWPVSHVPTATTPYVVSDPLCRLKATLSKEGTGPQSAFWESVRVNSKQCVYCVSFTIFNMFCSYTSTIVRFTKCSFSILTNIYSTKQAVQTYTCCMKRNT